MEAADITYKILPSVADQGKGEGWDVGNGLASSSLLIHSDTTDGSTTFVDTVGTHTPAVGAADVEHDTAQSRFGKTSILFDGDSGYLTIPDHADWNFGTAVFTVDFWVRFNALPTDGNRMGFWNQYVGIADNQRFDISNSGGTYTLTYTVDLTGIVVANTWSTPVINTWYHLALIRGWGGNVNDFVITVSGKALASATTDVDGTGDIAAAFLIGEYNGGNFFNGWIDEFRVSKGVARWTKNFIPPYGSYR